MAGRWPPCRKLNVMSESRLLVLSSLFPNAAQPAAGVFIRERMFRVARERALVVLAPRAWFPGQSIIRLFRPHFRPPAKRVETMSGIEIHRPRYLSVPGVLKGLDGLSMALCCWWTARRLVADRQLNILDAHFAYPDGYAGALLARWLRLPMTLTLRGQEARQSASPLRAHLQAALAGADQVITVSDALRALALQLGESSDRLRVIGNGIDTEKFAPIDRQEARRRLGLPSNARVLITVGTLIERKGFHRVIEVMPRLLSGHPELHYLVVGGAGPEGDFSQRLKALVQEQGVGNRVHFLGALAPDRLNVPLSAADVFVLASAYEGWANVLLEAMACGLPVVATDVGGNAQVVRHEWLGRVVRLGDGVALTEAIHEVLSQEWDAGRIREYAVANAWDERIPQLIALLDQVANEGRRAESKAAAMRRSVGAR